MQKLKAVCLVSSCAIGPLKENINSFKKNNNMAKAIKKSTILNVHVVDENKKQIPGAHVQVKDSNISNDTDRNGNCILTVNPGILTLTSEKEGFKPLDSSPITVAQGQTMQVELQMKVEKLVEPISATGEHVIEEFDARETKLQKTGETRMKEPLPVRLSPVKGKETNDQLLWDKIEKSRIDFNEYRDVMDSILNCNLEDLYNNPNEKRIDKNHLPFNRTEAYSLLKFATEKFVEKKLGLKATDLVGYFENGRLPYYNLILQRIKEFLVDDVVDGNDDVDACEDLLETKEQPILIELIWSYWHEEGMLVQTMNAIARRFQNIRNNERDPLANLELDPLRPLNNILWGYIQDAQHRLTISRRTYEYDHHYGIRLLGKAIPEFMPADSRSKFIQAFHNLLYRAALYFKEADDMTINADAFPLLNALREVHLLLAEGAHNQFGDLPTVARIEMLIEQWILSRPEIREFLGGRIMVPYDEPWMDRVDTMKTLQGWADTSISYYHDLAVYGEQIVLSIRFGNWSRVNDRDFARNWADTWRDAIQRYLHSYHSVTGVDLTIESSYQTRDEKYVMPAFLIQQKFQKEKALKRG